jgi:hypothetical protein
MSRELLPDGSGLAEMWRSLRSLASQLCGPSGVSEQVASRLANATRRQLYSHGVTRPVRWSDIGVDVERRPLATSGLLVTRGFPIRIWVNGTDDPRRQRFTVGHELGHYLIRRQPEVSSAQLESNCDIFAGEFLLPAVEVRSRLSAEGGLVRASDVLSLARVGQLSLSAVIRQVSRVAWDRDSFILLCKPDRGDLRIGLAAGGPIGHPPHSRRVSSLGTWKVRGSCDSNEKHGTASLSYRFVEGRTPDSDAARSGSISGLAKWNSIRLDHGVAIIVIKFLHISNLDYSALRERKALVVA